MSASVTKAVPHRILLATKDPVLRGKCKQLIASFGFYVVAPADEQQAKALIQFQIFDLLILGNTLDPKIGVELATEYRKNQPQGRIIEITAVLDASPFSNPD